jgi:hypothetical protein
MEYEISASGGISLSEIESMQRLVPAQDFFNLGYDLASLSHDKVSISTQEELTLTIDGPDDIELMVKLTDMNENELENAVFAQADYGTYRVNVIFPEEKEYSLKIYGKKRDLGGGYPFLFSYKIYNQIGADANLIFPAAYSAFNERACYLNEPLKKSLVFNEWQDFSLKIPGAEKAAVVIDGKWTHLGDDSDYNFSGNVHISGQDVMVYAKFSENENYTALLKYKVSE